MIADLRHPYRLARRIFGLIKPARDKDAAGQMRPNYLMVDVSIIARQDSNTGIQRVVRSVWKHFHHDVRLRDMEIVAVRATARHGYCYADPNFLERESGDAPTLRPCEARPGDVFLGLDLVTHALPANRRQISQWKKLGIPIHLVIYDLLPALHPQWFNRRTSRNFRRWLEFVAVYADTALGISDQVVADTKAVLSSHARWQNARARVCRVRLGSDILERAADAETPAADAIPPITNRPFVLMVGTIEPRKGYEFALEIFERLWAESKAPIALVIAGRPGWKTARLQRRLREHPMAGHLLFWLDSVDDQQLLGLYGEATMLLSVSRAEGFGLPIAEARAQALSVLATDLPVFRELCDEGVRYFDAGNVEQAAKLVTEIVASVQAGDVKTRSQIYSWQEASLNMLGVIGLGDRVLAE